MHHTADYSLLRDENCPIITCLGIRMKKNPKATVSWFLGWRIDRWAKKSCGGKKIGKKIDKFFKCHISAYICTNGLFFFSFFFTLPNNCSQNPCEKSAIPGINWQWPKGFHEWNIFSLLHVVRKRKWLDFLEKKCFVQNMEISDVI